MVAFIYGLDWTGLSVAMEETPTPAENSMKEGRKSMNDWHLLFRKIREVRKKLNVAREKKSNHA